MEETDSECVQYQGQVVASRWECRDVSMVPTCTIDFLECIAVLPELLNILGHDANSHDQVNHTCRRQSPRSGPLLSTFYPRSIAVRKESIKIQRA